MFNPKLEPFQKDAKNRAKFLTEMLNRMPVGELMNSKSEDVFGDEYYLSSGIFGEIDRLKEQVSTARFLDGGLADD